VKNQDQYSGNEVGVELRNYSGTTGLYTSHPRVMCSNMHNFLATVCSSTMLTQIMVSQFSSCPFA